jgi:hypothetical protein
MFCYWFFFPLAIGSYLLLLRLVLWSTIFSQFFLSGTVFCARQWGVVFTILCGVADLHHVAADPDPDSACHFDTYSYPDPTFHLDADLDPSLQIKAQDLEKVIK